MAKKVDKKPVTPHEKLDAALVAISVVIAQMVKVMERSGGHDPREIEEMRNLFDLVTDVE